MLLFALSILIAKSPKAQSSNLISENQLMIKEFKVPFITVSPDHIYKESYLGSVSDVPINTVVK